MADQQSTDVKRVELDAEIVKQAKPTAELWGYDSVEHYIADIIQKDLRNKRAIASSTTRAKMEQNNE